MTRRAGTATAVTLVGLLLVAGGALVGILVSDGPAAPSLQAPPETGIVDVISVPFDDSREISFEVRVGAGTPLVATATGTVTAAHCKAGHELSSGESLLSLDDTPILALGMTTPPWRDLALGTRGSDVGALNVELRRLGFEADAGDRFGLSTRAAVRALQERAGVARPTGNLPRASVMWLRGHSVRISSCDVALGDLHTGGKVATSGGGLVALKAQHLPDDVVAGERVVAIGETTSEMVDRQVTDSDALTAFEASPEYQVWKATEGTGQPPKLRWSLVEPRTAAVVPPGALAHISAGTACLATPEGAVAVEVLGSALGKAYVSPVEGPAPTQVLTGATSDATC